jgi:hypothetical protein
MERFAVQYTYNGLYWGADGALIEEPEWFDAREAAEILLLANRNPNVIAESRIVAHTFGSGDLS